MKEIWMGLLALEGAAAVALLLRAYVFLLVRVKGSSMANTLRDRDVLLATRFGKYRRGQVVLCRFPRRVEWSFSLGASLSLNWHTIFVKRLVALPGDTVEIAEGQLLINDQPVPNPPAMASLPRDYPRHTLGKKQYFVIGDHRASSHDSRAADVGPLTRDMLQGHVRAVVWPLRRMGKVR